RTHKEMPVKLFLAVGGSEDLAGPVRGVHASDPLAWIQRLENSNSHNRGRAPRRHQARAVQSRTEISVQRGGDALARGQKGDEQSYPGTARVSTAPSFLVSVGSIAVVSRPSRNLTSQLPTI